MQHVKIQSKKNSTHNVVHIKTDKPKNISFRSGQAVDVSLNKPDWEKELRPFTFTSLPSDDYLEFFIKIYPEHNGVTNQIDKLNQGDSLLIGDVFGDIEYKSEGIFIAGGAGITPFISIFKKLEKENKVGSNKLIYANKTKEDIIERSFFSNLLGKNFINVLSKQKVDGFENGYITKQLIESQIQNKNTQFYLCGPPPMMDAVLKQLKELDVPKDNITKEQY